MFKSDNELLTTLLNKVENHDIQLPDFQRRWVWEDNRIKSLLASLSLGYPIGAIMLLESGGDFNFKCKNIEGSGKGSKDPESMVLDGQQRLTSAFQAMRMKKPVSTWTDQKKKIKRYYYLDIEKALNTTTDRVEAIVSVNKNKQIKGNIGRDIVLDLSTKENEFKNKMIPFNILTNQEEMSEWIRKYEEYYDYDRDIIVQDHELVDNILQPLLNYRVPIIEVLKETPKDAVCQVFENVNQGGVPLNVFELLTATFAADEFDLKKHWKDIKKIFKKYETLKKIDNTSFLLAMTLLVSYKKGEKISCKRKDVLNLKYYEFQEYEEELVKGFKTMYDLLVEMNIYSHSDIPYTTQFIPVAVICAILKNDVYNANVKKKLKTWFWCGVFGELYGSANESRFALDVPQVIDWIMNDGAVPKTVNDCNFSAMRLLSLRTKNSAAYKGVIALIMGNHSKDWISGMEISVQNYIEERSDVHHIFPQSYCVKLGYNKDVWNSIINKTPIFFSTNRYIGGVSPSEYISKIIKNKNISEDDLKSFIESHLVDFELLNSNKFDEFILDRGKKLLDLIEEATGKKITDRSSDEVISYFGSALE